MSNFSFLRSEWPAIAEAAVQAEDRAAGDPRTACFWARRALELAVRWAFRHDGALRMPYQESLSAMVHEPSFRAAAGEVVFNKARLITRLGNLAVHGNRPVSASDAVAAVRELFHVCYWLARTYAFGAPPATGLVFDAEALHAGPAAESTPAASTPAVPAPMGADALRALEEELRERDERIAAMTVRGAALDEELKRARAEVAAAKKANAARPDDHDYTEAATRDLFIDLLLKEAGWPLDAERDREYPVTGMPTASGQGFVDYVLWGADGRPLAIVEAKRTRRDPRAGQQQAKLYADCLEAQFGVRPVLYYTNGYEHWLWDDTAYPPRAVQGFGNRDELELMVQRRTARRRLADVPIDAAIADRYYQERAIRRVAEAFDRDRERRALLVMATGAGKTRTVIALADLLMRANWARRVLFLADRRALVKQAVGAFKRHLPDCAPVNLLDERDAAGRVYVSTYATMMGRIDEMRAASRRGEGGSSGERRFGVEHFDLIVIDEAHRSIYRKYAAIFEYFDALIVGLTATPKDEVDRNTYSFFELESGVPTDAYSLEDAVADGFLVPPRPVAVPVKFHREGIRYDDLSEEEREQWDEIEWSEEQGADGPPDEIAAGSLNRWLFNKDTVDKVLAHLMERGLKVAGGDRLAKTIIFATNHDHAVYIAERFDAHYPQHAGHFARVIDFKVEHAQNLIDDFSKPEKMPHIAISVDMLDTGVDIPEVANLVFFKLVRSKTKFWQMVGRGTRLRPDLFGPGRHKEFFYLFDYCGNLEFFGHNAEGVEGGSAAPLGERLFGRRVELIVALDTAAEGRSAGSQGAGGRVAEPVNEYAPTSVRGLREEVAERLREEVAAMNPDNFIVRPRRALVQKYAQPETWERIGPEDAEELVKRVAPLPTERAAEDEEAKRFDLLILNLQLAMLRSSRSFKALRARLEGIADLLVEKGSIPMVAAEMPLILEIGNDLWWEHLTVTTLEQVRKRLRDLVKLIDKAKRRPIYTDFEDEIGVGSEMEIGAFTAPDAYTKFLAKARAFLREHENHLAIHKVRNNEPLTPADLEELERMFATSGVGTPEDVEKAKRESHGLGLFVRSLVGMNREAAKAAFGAFLAGGTMRANQIEFVNMIIDHLTEHGSMEPELLYASPYTDFNPRGVEGMFESAQVVSLLTVLREIHDRAAA